MAIVKTFLPYTWYNLELFPTYGGHPLTSRKVNLLCKRYNPQEDQIEYFIRENCFREESGYLSRQRGQKPVEGWIGFDPHERPLAFMIIIEEDFTLILPHIEHITNEQKLRLEQKERIKAEEVENAVKLLTPKEGEEPEHVHDFTSDPVCSCGMTYKECFGLDDPRDA